MKLPRRKPETLFHPRKGACETLEVVNEVGGNVIQGYRVKGHGSPCRPVEVKRGKGFWQAAMPSGHCRPAWCYICIYDRINGRSPKGFLGVNST